MYMCYVTLQGLAPYAAAVAPTFLPTPSAERPSSSNIMYQQQPPTAGSDIMRSTSSAGHQQGNNLSSANGGPGLAVTGSTAGLAVVTTTQQLPTSPLPQHKLLMPNSADKLADTGKVKQRVCHVMSI